MEIDFSSVLNSIKKVEDKLSSVATTHRNLEWEDEVHNSYQKLVVMSESNKDKLNSNINQIGSIERELKSIKPSNRVSAQVGQIAKQSNSIRA